MMIKAAIMQPYFLPYIGYWQLINAVDDFVILDDVNYIMRGYINRNNILLNDKAHLFSIPIRNASQNRLISETKLNFFPKDKEKLLKMIRSGYRKAPYFREIYTLFENIVNFNADDITDYIENSLRTICGRLGITARISRSSKYKKNIHLKAQDRIIAICKHLEAGVYINPPGGRALYRCADFKNAGILLKFLQPGKISYGQFNADFVGNLSLLDVLMFNDTDTVKCFLEDYSLDEND